MSKAQRKQPREHVITQKDLKAAKKEKTAVEVIKVTKEQQKQIDAQTTVSAKIRYMHAEGFPNTQIAKHLNKRYQHVRNVLETPLKRKVA